MTNIKPKKLVTKKDINNAAIQ